jgi:hypothetical protein
VLACNLVKDKNMRSIKLEKFPEVMTAEVLKSVVELVPRGQGVNVSDMRWRLQMLDKIDAADGELLVEDADHEKLNAMIATFPFGVVNADLVKIADAVEKAEKVEVSRPG